MHKTVLTVYCLILTLLTSSFLSLAHSPDETLQFDGIGVEPGKDGWWNHWIRDRDHNGIDDVLDDIIASNPETDRTRVFIDYSSHPTEVDVARLSEFDLQVKYVYKYINTICARNVLLSDIEKLSQLQNVVMVEYEDEVHGDLDVSTKAVKAEASQEYSPSTVDALNIFGRDVSIAILDSGVDDGPAPALPPYHQSLDDLDDDTDTDDPKFIAGVDVTTTVFINDGSYNPDDKPRELSFGHGTHVAGIAMGTSAGTDYRGVAPQARLVDVKVMEEYGSGNMGDLIQGIEWCVEHKDEFNIRVISMSLGSNYNSDGSDAGSQAVNAAVDEGIIAVAAIGNGGSSIIGPPASADKIISVGAIDDMGTINRSDDQIWSSSNRGPRNDDGDDDHLDELKPDVVAPGVNIMSAKANSPSAYISYSGTSMACPHVAGVIALMLEANPDLTPDLVKSILHQTSEMPPDIQPSTQYDDKYNYAWGWGMVDAFEAVRMAQLYDPRPPIISDIEEHVSGVTATIMWRTHKEANATIFYGKIPGLLDEVYEDPDNFVFEHSVTLSDLEEDTEYYYRIIGYDEQGNGPGESDIRSFHTEILPDSKPPEIMDFDIIGKSDRTATIFWETDELSNSSIEYGPTAEYGNIKSDLKLMFKHSITLFDLEPSTMYHFRINATDASGNTNLTQDLTFETEESPDITPPSISNLKVTDITETTATIVWATNEPTNLIVRYGEDTKYGVTVSVQDYYWKMFSIKITGLNPSTIYYYQVESADPSGNTKIVGDASTWFNTTGPPDITPPQIIDGPKVTVLTDTTATIEWITDEESDSTVEYGLSTGYGLPPVSSGEYLLVHNITLTDLSPSTTYHFRVRSTDKSPNANEVISDDNTFTTKSPPDLIPPKILSDPTLLVGEHTATIIWTTDEKSDSELHYGTTTNYGLIANDTSLVTEHTIILTGLSHSTTYHYKVISSDASGNSVESDDYTFTTLEITIPIEIEFLNLQNGQIVKGVITIEGRISGGMGSIERVRYKVGNESWQNLGTGSTFSIVLDTTKYSEGEHRLYVEAKVGDMTMQEDVTFVVERPPGEEENILLWVLFLIIALVIILAFVLAISRSRAKKRAAPRESSFISPFAGSEAPFPMDVYSPADTGGLRFLPDEQLQPLASQEAETGVSFIPETATLSEEPEITFVPDREPISFNISEEELGPPVFDVVRCPRCKSLFNADVSSKIVCPDCGFSAGLK